MAIVSTTKDDGRFLYRYGEPSSTISGDCYHHDKSKRMFGFRLGSRDPKHYDQIITKLNLQAREQEQHELVCYSIKQQQVPRRKEFF